MEQQSNYIYISAAAAFDTREASESKEIKIFQGFYGDQRRLWGRVGG